MIKATFDRLAFCGNVAGIMIGNVCGMDALTQLDQVDSIIDTLDVYQLNEREPLLTNVIQQTVDNISVAKETRIAIIEKIDTELFQSMR